MPKKTNTTTFYDRQPRQPMHASAYRKPSINDAKIKARERASAQINLRSSVGATPRAALSFGSTGDDSDMNGRLLMLHAPH